MISFLTALALAAAVWLCLPVRPGRPGIFNDDDDGSSPRWRAVAIQAWSRLPGARGAAETSPVFVRVAGLLRAGVPLAVAWRRGAGVAVDELGLPDADSLALAVGAEPAQSMVAAAQVAQRLGAPLARVLENMGETLAAEAEIAAERAAAFAGPQTTARVLLALPLLGLLLGTLLGANPLAVIASGPAGLASLVVGTGLLLAGRVWIKALIASAEAAG